MQKKYNTLYIYIYIYNITLFKLSNIKHYSTEDCVLRNDF